MRAKRRLQIALGATWVSLASVAGVWGAGDPPQSPPQSQEQLQQLLHVKHSLVVQMPHEPATLDWNLSDRRIDRILIENLQEGLVRISDQSMQIEPALAERWEISPDGKTYTFHLRSGVVWSDGVPLVADQFVASWKRLLSPVIATPNRSFVLAAEGADAYASGKLKDFTLVGIHAIDALTLQIKFREPTWNWLWYAAHPATYPIREDLIDKLGEKAWTAPGSLVTLGAYRLHSHLQDEKFVFERNPRYYGSRGNLDEVEFRILPEEDGVEAFVKGEVDLVCYAQKAAISHHAIPPVRIRYFEPTITKRLDINVKGFPGSAQGFREAIARAIDRAALAKAVGGGSRPASSSAPPTLDTHLDSIGLPYDVKRAQELMRKSLPVSQGVGVDLMVALFDENAADNLETSKFIKQALEEKLKLRVSTYGYDSALNYSLMRDAYQYSILIRDWTVDLPDPLAFYSFYESKNGRSTSWSNPKYDAFVARAREEKDPNRRRDDLRQAEKVLVEEDIGMVPLYYSSEVALVGPKVVGFKGNPFVICNLRGVSKP